VARALALCEDDAVIGTAFYVMEYVAGRVFWDPQLPELPREERAAVHGEINRVIAALHSVDYEAAGLGDYGRPGEYIARQVARWSKQYQASETEKIEAMDRLIAWLPENIPAGDETRIVHGDYRIDNVIFHPTEPRILAVLDWELSTLGHPIADFAVPSAQTMRAVLDSIHASLGRQERIYLHCRAGIGRTGTVAGCLLVDFGLSGAEALALLQRKWKSTRRSTTDPHTPETTAQHAFVLAWRARAHPCGADAAARQSPRESAIEGN
jgi:aminoglycoside phosphotransferase (APT) family kinase protein